MLPKKGRFVRMLQFVAVGVVGLAVIGAATEAIASASDRRSFHRPGKLVDAGGYRLHVDCRGTGGPTVIFESGSGGTSLDWALVQPEIARTNRACSYDRAGYGWSDAAPTHTLQRMRHDFDVVLRDAGPGPYVLVAHSFGGLLISDHATRHPADVAGLVFVDAAVKPIYEHMNAAYPQFVKNGNKLAVVTTLGSFLTRFGVTRLVRQPASPKTVAPSVRAGYRAVGYQPKAYRAFADDLRAFPHYVEAAQDDPPHVPTVVLTHTEPGTLWQGLPSAGAERMWQDGQHDLAVRMHAPQIHVSSTHFIQVLHPDAVIGAIQRVLAQIRP